MDPKKNNDNKPHRPGGGKGSNWQGLIQVICWAGVLAILLSYASNYMRSAGHQSTSVELEYTEFHRLVETGQIESVNFDTEEAILNLTPADGFTYQDEAGVSYTKTGTDKAGNPVYQVTLKDGKAGGTVSLRFFTVQIESNDATVAYLRQFDGV